MKQALVLWLLLFAASAATLGSSFKDVSLDSHYKSLARKHSPTLLHEVGTEFFPMEWMCDGDRNVENNVRTYTTSCHRWVIIHILKDVASNYIYIQYWYYYAFNPCPPEVAQTLSNPLPTELQAFAYLLATLSVTHTHDWELAIVILDPSERAVSLALGAHGELHPHAWSEVHKDSDSPTHPFIYVYEGSHAMNFRPADPAPWYFGLERWGGGASYTTWEDVRYAFIGTSDVYPPRFGDYPAPWRRSIWTKIPHNLDGAGY